MFRASGWTTLALPGESRHYHTLQPSPKPQFDTELRTAAALTDLLDVVEAARHRDEVELDLWRLRRRLHDASSDVKRSDRTRRRMSASVAHCSA